MVDFISSSFLICNKGQIFYNEPDRKHKQENCTVGISFADRILNKYSFLWTGFGDYHTAWREARKWR